MLLAHVTTNRTYLTQANVGMGIDWPNKIETTSIQNS